MDSLEFINLEIAITNTKYKEHLKFVQFELAIKDEKRLNTLQQIKSELEAWYEIKDLYLKGYFSRVELPMECHEKFKKALEVKNETKN